LNPLFLIIKEWILSKKAKLRQDLQDKQDTKSQVFRPPAHRACDPEEENLEIPSPSAKQNNNPVIHL
jgi:hypothetical protein